MLMDGFIDIVSMLWMDLWYDIYANGWIYGMIDDV